MSPSLDLILPNGSSHVGGSKFRVLATLISFPFFAWKRRNQVNALLIIALFSVTLAADHFRKERYKVLAELLEAIP